MIGLPTDALPFIRGVQLVISGYSGYTKGKRKETDLIVRQEIIRASGRVQTHLTNVHDQSYRDGNIKVTRACKQVMEEVDQFRNEVDKAETGGEHPFFSNQKSASKSDLKKLIKHDHDVIEMVTKAVNIANSCEHAHATGGEEGEVIRLARQCQQMISSCRGFFAARLSLLKGMKRA
ncbi:MAG: hypothetical protein QF817_02320 [Candidatus Poseidoniaceae archaeon]|jgi:hypothetical protein|nr:hypothetical protein [Candidatus Poseidoniaceae archaeon]